MNSEFELKPENQEKLSIPFKPLPYSVLEINPALSSSQLDWILSESHQWDAGTARWHFVRRRGSPTGPGVLSGIEKYFVGGQSEVIIDGYRDTWGINEIPHPNFHYQISQVSPEEIVRIITQEGAWIKKGWHPCQRFRYYDTLTGERVDQAVFIHLYTQFETLLSRLRAASERNPTNKIFRQELERLDTPHIEYRLCHGLPTDYKVVFSPSQMIPLELSFPANYPDRIDPSDPYGIIQLMGKFTHPLVRAAYKTIPHQDIYALRNKITV